MSDSEPDEGKRSFNAVAKPEPEEASPPPEETKSRRNWFAMPEGALGFFVLLLLAAACGGLIAVYWPWLAGNGDASALTDRLATLETRVGQIAAGQAPEAAAASFEEMERNLAALKARIDADEARLAALETSAPGGGGSDTGPLKSALDKNTSDLTQLSARLDKLEQTQAAGQGAADPKLTARIEAGEKALAGLRDELDTQAKANTALLDKLDARIAGLEKNAPPADLGERLDSFALKSGVATLDARVGRLESQDTAGLMRRAAAMLALADLVRASGHAQPFDSELNALKVLMPPSAEIADLARHAHKGAPTVTALAARFGHDIDAILAAERASRAKNWIERVWYDFVNLVSVRRVGNVAGNDTEARVARAEFALKNGDLPAAVAEVRAFDKPAKAAAASWLRDAEARLAVDRDARALTNRIVSDLAATPDAVKSASPSQTDAPQ